AHHEDGVRVERKVLAVPEAGHGPPERPGELTRRPARMIGDAVRRLPGEERDGAGVGRETAPDVIRRPGTCLLVLGDAIRVACGMTERRHRWLAGTRSADVDHEQS